MRQTRLIAAGVAAVLLSGVAVGVEPDALRTYQGAQLRARQMAGELIADVLDGQLEQFRCNQLTDLPVYQDIVSMRQNVQRLTDVEMKDVVVLLTKAQQVSPDQREALFAQARSKVREVVKTLAAERQRLLERMRVARMSDQANHLLEMQRAVHKLTLTLPEIADLEARETRAVSAVQDQRDVNTMLLALVDELSIISGWGPPAGAAASDGLRMLRAHKVSEHALAAARLIESVDYAKGAAEQKAVIDGLTALLYQVGTSGATRLSFSQLLNLLTELQRRQQALQAVTQKASAAEAPQLADQQRGIHRDLGMLAQRLTHIPPTAPHLENAKASALKAAQVLAAAAMPQAMEPQKAVLASLSAVEALLRASEQTLGSDKTAAQLADELTALMRLDEALTLIRAQHDQIEGQLGNAAQAAASEKSIADLVAAEHAKYPMIPQVVATRLVQAKDAALEAFRVIPLATERARPAVKATAEALDQAHAAVKRALADANRKALGVKIGELARAIDALERASVAERAQAVRARLASNDGGFKPEAAKKFVQEQQTVSNVARGVAEGIKDTAPSAVKAILQAQALVDQSRERIAKDIAADPARQASVEALQASDLLAEATKLVRGEIVAAAGQLDEAASRELVSVEKVAEGVDAALTAAEKSVANQLAAVEAAQQKVLTARADQLRAAGQEQAAQAADMADKLNQAATAQAAAAAAIARYGRGEANTPLEAVNELQKTVDLALEMLKDAARRPAALEAQKAGRVDGVTAKLQDVQQAAETAVRAMLEGNTPQAAKAVAIAQQSLTDAQTQAQSEESAAQTAAPGAINLKAQQRVTENATAAAALSKDAAPQAAGQLDQAAAKSAQAGKQIEAGAAAPEARKTQADVAAMLNKALKDLEAAKAKLAEAAKQDLAAQQAKAAALAAQAKNVEPTAGTALKRAEQAAEQGAKSGTQAGKAAPQAQQDVKKNIEQAAANLQAKKQELQRDKKLADTFKDLAKQQQKAREELIALAAQMGEAAPQPKLPPNKRNNPDQPKLPDDGKKKPSGPQPPSHGAIPQESKGDKDQGAGAADPTAQLQKPGKAPAAESPPGQSGLAPAGQQQAQPQQPEMPKSDKKDEDLNKAKALASALGDYIGAQEEMGDMAEKLSQQKKVANKPLKEALKEAAKLNPNLDRAPQQEFIPPETTPIFPPSNKPPLPPQIAGGGAMPQQRKMDKSEGGEKIPIPPQTQGPQNPATAVGQAQDTNNPQVQNPPEEGVNASTVIQTAPITSPAQPAAPPSAPGVFEPNTGKPSPATPTGRSTPPPPPPAPKKQDKPADKQDQVAKKPEDKDKPKEKKKRTITEASDQPPPAPKPLGDEFKPVAPEETAEQIATKPVVDKALETLDKNGELPKDDADKGDEDEEVEIVKAPPQPKQDDKQDDKPPPGKTGTTPGDLGMGQGTPGKGVGGESTGNPTEDRPQKGNQHGKFDGKRPWAKVGKMDDLIPKGEALPPGFKPEPKNDEPPEDPFALPEKAKPNVTPPDVDPNAPQNFGGGKGGGLNKPGRRTADAKVAAKKHDDKPWFAKLPPELRAAIQSSAKTQPPPGYEEKLQNYRQSVK
ncbi:MAG: hypothetical protein ABFD92_02295 [Planctomycetaceae bacterium]|nr:hypothetical protein [Planctomycetaceae bacterium]